MCNNSTFFLSLNLSWCIVALIIYYVLSSRTKCITLVLLSWIPIMFPLNNICQQETMIKHIHDYFDLSHLYLNSLGFDVVLLFIYLLTQPRKIKDKINTLESPISCC